MTKTAMIECPSCGGNGGMGVYCEDCQCTGRVSVPTNVAEHLAWLEKHATAETQRAEAAEADARVLRTLFRAAAIHHSASIVLMPGEDRSVGEIMRSYVAMLFKAAGDNGAFANDHCDPAAVDRVAVSLGVILDAQEAQPAKPAPVPAAQSVILPLPPSVNHYYVNTGRGGRALSQEARNYKAAAELAVYRAHLVRYTGPVAVTMHVYRERKAGDLDNRVKLTLDSLNGHAWADDAQVVELHAYRHDDAANPRVEVEIRTVTEVTQ